MTRADSARASRALASYLYSLVIASVLGGCAVTPDAFSEDGPGQQTQSLSTALCDRVEIVDIISCDTDLNCPCGSFCAERVCAQQCLDDEDCSGGELCDIQGRCAPPGPIEDAPTTEPPPAETGSRGTLLVAPTQQFVVADRTAYEVYLAAKDFAVPDVHVVAGEGMKVRCAGSVAASDCRLSLLADLPAQRVDVLLDPFTPPAVGQPDKRWSLHVFDQDRSTTVDLTLPAPPPAGAAPVPGVYEGLAVAEAMEIQRRQRPAWTDMGHERPSNVVKVPVRVSVFADTSVTGGYRLKVEDLYGAFAERRVFTARLAPDSTGGFALSADLMRTIGKQAPGLHEASIHQAGTGSGRIGSSGMQLELITSNAHVIHCKGQLSPCPGLLLQRWGMSLRRTGNLPSNATWTDLPSDLTVRDASVETSRFTTTLPWSNAVAAVVGPPRKIFESEDKVLVKRLLMGHRNNPLSLFQAEWDRTYTSWTMPNEDVVANTMCALGFEESYFNRVYPSDPLSYRAAACQWAARNRQCEGQTECDRRIVDPEAQGGAQQNAAVFLPLVADYKCTYEDHPQFDSCKIKSYRDLTTVVDVAQRYTCFHNSPGVYNLASVQTGSALSAVGDKRCSDGRPQEAFGLLAQRDLPDDEARSASEMLAACVHDLVRAIPANPSVSVAKLAEVFQHEGCVDLARVHRALDWLSRPGMQRAGGESFPVAEQKWAAQNADAALNRLVQQWLTVAMFVAREGSKAQTTSVLMSDLVLTQPEKDVLHPQPVATLLDRVEGALDLLLHPRVGSVLALMDGRVLHTPARWSHFILPPEYAASDVAAGVPVTMLETLSAHAGLLQTYLEREPAFTPGLDTASRTRLSNFLRRLVQLRSLANGMYFRAQTEGSVPDPDPWAFWQGGPVSWLSRWNAANDELDAAVSRLLSKADEIERGTTPLGIDANDLPLYFSDIHTTPGTRFAALSSYLLDHRASQDVGAAVTAMNAARSSYISANATRVQERRDGLDDTDRLSAIKREYGRPVLELCGARPGWTAENVLDGTKDLSPVTCFVDTQTPACNSTPAMMPPPPGPAELQSTLCKIATLRNQTGLALKYTNSALNASVNGIATKLKEGKKPPVALAGVSFSGDRTQFSIGANSFPSALLQQTPTDMALVISSDASAARALCEGYFVSNASAQNEIAMQQNDAVNNPACYLGTLGQDVLAMVAAQRDVKLAISQFTEHTERYDIAMKSCLLVEQGAVDVNSEMNLHQFLMQGYLDDKARLEKQRAGGSLLGGLASLAGNPASIVQGVLTGLDFGTGLVLADVNKHIAEQEIGHAVQLERIKGQTTVDVCYNDAQLHIVGIRSAGIQMDRAGVDLTAASARLLSHRNMLESALLEGRAVIQREEDRNVPQVGHDYWLSSNINEAERTMRVARRSTFLAARAIGYEFQTPTATQALEQAVLAAQTPNDLTAVLQELTTYSATGQPQGGGRIANLWEVLSMRDEILKLADMTDVPDTANLTAKERFHRILTLPRFAAYDAAGNYVGQRIPFTLSPHRAQPQAPNSGVGTVGFEEDCAERLWSVNAIIVGAGAVGTEQTARLNLLQHNTFHSKWCTAPTASAPAYQVATVHPQRNLFRDPIGGSMFDLPVTESRYSRARITSHVNTPAAAYEVDGYTQGASLELAARGVYGQYILEIPTATIAQLKLSKLEDIVLRFDYVSSSRPVRRSAVSTRLGAAAESLRTTTSASN